MNTNDARKRSKLIQFIDDVSSDVKQASSEVNEQEQPDAQHVAQEMFTEAFNNLSNSNSDATVTTYENQNMHNTNLFSEANIDNNNNYFDNINESINDNTPVEPSSENVIPLQVVPKQSEYGTVIAKNTLIRGTVYSDDGIEVNGKIIGDIECKQDMLINGKVKGTTSSQNAKIVDAVIDGSLNCNGELSVNHNSWVVGNLKSAEAEINGKIKGNINTRDNLFVGNDAIIMGDISTGELEIKKGAFVNGRINMYQASKEVIDTFESLVED